MNTRHPHPRAFTLVELVLALAIAVIVLGATQSIIMLAAKSVPVPGKGPFGVVQAVIPLEQLATDLQSASMILSATDRSLELILPDRDLDGFPDNARYAWSGMPGTPLQRTYRGNRAATWDNPQSVIPNLSSLAFTHDRIAPTTPTSANLPETLLASFEPLSGIDGDTITSSSTSAQSFQPLLPTSAITFRITRIALRVGRSGSSTGLSDIVLTPATLGNLPANTVLATATLDEDNLVSPRLWVEIPLQDSPDLAPGQTLAFKVLRASGSASAVVEYGGSSNSTLSGTRSTSLTGSTWLPATGALAYRVYGVFSTATSPEPQSAPRYAGCSLRFSTLGGGAGSSVELSFTAPNRPQAP